MPRRSSSLPESISNPIAATAITAIVVATVPSAMACTHPVASAIGLPAGGSESDEVGGYISMSSMTTKHEQTTAWRYEQASTTHSRLNILSILAGRAKRCGLWNFQWTQGVLRYAGWQVKQRSKMIGAWGAMAALFYAATAHAQEYADPAGSGVLVSAVRWLEGTLLGTVATVVAVIAVATVGFLMLTGRINWRYGATVILGCFILFGAASIVAGIQSTASLGR